MTLTQVAGLWVAVLLALILTINAVFMIVSPRRWFQLPNWLKATGSLTERRYASGWGGDQVRLAGAVLLAFIIAVVWDVLMKR